MEELAGETGRNEKARVDQYDIWYNIKRIADDVADKAVQVLEEGSSVLVEDIIQDFMDRIQTPESTD